MRIRAAFFAVALVAPLRAGAETQETRALEARSFGALPAFRFTPAPIAASAPAVSAEDAKIDARLRGHMGTMTAQEKVTVIVVLAIPKPRLPGSIPDDQRRRALDRHYERHARQVLDYLLARQAGLMEMRTLGMLSASLTAEQVEELSTFAAVRSIEADQPVRAFR